MSSRLIVSSLPPARAPPLPFAGSRSIAGSALLLLGIVVEALAGLAAEVSRLHHVPQQSRSGEPGPLRVFIEHLADQVGDLATGEVHELDGAHGEAGAELHRLGGVS